MRVLIAEEALETGTGHWPGYIGGITRGLRAAGDRVDILVHKNCRPELIREMDGTPLFSRNCWLDPASQGGFGGLQHNLIFYRELKSWICSRDKPYDMVCALTMRLQHLLAFALLSRCRAIPRQTQFLLLFVQGFGVYDAESGQSIFPLNSSTLLARFCFYLMSKAVRSGRVVLAAETKGMQKELQSFTGLPVAQYPHPVPPPGNPDSSVVENDRITLTCPGFARHEKGSDLLLDAILMLLEDKQLRHLHFILQWPAPFEMPDGTLAQPSETLLNHPQVEFINDNLNVTEYESLLWKSDIILLPYRRGSYHNRVSRVAIEGAGRGKPFVYMSGTWIEEVAGITQAGVPIKTESAEAVADAIRLSVQEFVSLKVEAEARADKLIQYHSTDHFRRLMEEKTDNE